MKSVLSFLKRRWWLIGLAIVIIGVLLWRNNQQARAKQEIETVTPVRKNLQQTIEFSGEVDAHERALLHFAAPGKLVYVGAQEGDAVKKWQIIANLDQRAVNKTLQKTLSTYQSQRWTFENEEDTREHRTLGESEQREADLDQFALDRSVMDVEIQSYAIDSNRLTAPFTGILVSSPVRTAGVNVSVTDEWEIANPETLYFYLLVDEVDIDMVHEEQFAIVRLDAQPDQELRAKVSKIGLVSRETSDGTAFPVELEFLDPVSVQVQRLGMNGDASIILGERTDVLSIPLDALTKRDGKSYVSVLVNGKPEEREIQTDLETDDDVEVTSGLAETDAVVLP